MLKNFLCLLFIFYEIANLILMQGIQKYTKVLNGYTTIGNVTTPLDLQPKDMMESFFLGETLKYLYLLMAEKHEIDLNQWVSTYFPQKKPSGKFPCRLKLSNLRKEIFVLSQKIKGIQQFCELIPIIYKYILFISKLIPATRFSTLKLIPYQFILASPDRSSITLSLSQTMILSASRNLSVIIVQFITISLHNKYLFNQIYKSILLSSRNLEDSPTLQKNIPLSKNPLSCHVSILIQHHA